MADFAAIASVSKSIEGVLNAAFTEHQPVTTGHTRAALVTTADFVATQTADRIGPYALSIFLYRVDKTSRAAWSSAGSPAGRGHLALDLHYLLTARAGTAENEHRILGRAIQAIEATPMLSGPQLDPSAHWAADETVHLLIARDPSHVEEIPTEVVVQVFESLSVDFRLSVPYVARIARFDTQFTPQTPTVTGGAGRSQAEAVDALPAEDK